jgi:hypothetical protein
LNTRCSRSYNIRGVIIAVRDRQWERRKDPIETGRNIMKSSSKGEILLAVESLKEWR